MGVVSADKIKATSDEILNKLGVPFSEAELITDTIVDAHRKGRHSHGIGRMTIYARKIREGLMTASTVLSPFKQRQLISVYSANNGFGQVAAHASMSECIEKADKHGISAVAVKDSNSFGVAGYFGEQAAKSGMIGIVMGNASPALAPLGGNKSILGTNPICVAFPGTEKNPHIIFDMACSVAARGKIRLAAKNGEKIPLDWAYNENGEPTDDPNAALAGSLNPIGGYKGFGLALVVDIFAGLISGSAFGGDVKALNAPNNYSRYGHFFMAINPEFFIDPDEYKERIDYLICKIKECGDPGKIFMPGEIEYKNQAAQDDNFKISDVIINDINELVRELNLTCLL